MGFGEKMGRFFGHGDDAAAGIASAANRYDKAARETAPDKLADGSSLWEAFATEDEGVVSDQDQAQVAMQRFLAEHPEMEAALKAAASVEEAKQLIANAEAEEQEAA